MLQSEKINLTIQYASMNWFVSLYENSDDDNGYD